MRLTKGRLAVCRANELCLGYPDKSLQSPTPLASARGLQQTGQRFSASLWARQLAQGYFGPSRQISIEFIPASGPAKFG